MSSSTTSIPTPAAFLNAVGGAVLNGGATSKRGDITTAGGLNNAIASQLFGLGAQDKASSTADGLSPFLSDATDTGALKNSITNALLGGSVSARNVQSVAALGATLNMMVRTAQSALATPSSTQRAQALSSFQKLYDTLDQASATIDGAAGNAASLGLSAPGDWTDGDNVKATAAITQDMAAAVKAHTALQEMTRSVGATLMQSYLLG